MFDKIILEIIQGVAEWLPISSEGLLVLARVRLFGSSQGISENIHEALFLHFGALTLPWASGTVVIIMINLNTAYYKGTFNPEVKNS